MSNVQINPEWLAYNNGMNEGGEGFNPHAKWIPRQTCEVRSFTGDQLVRDYAGRTVRASKLRESMALDEKRLARITDPTARDITQRYIDHAKQQLGL